MEECLRGLSPFNTFIPESPRWLAARGLAARTPAALLRQGIPWSELRRPGIVKAMAIGCAIAILGQFMGVNAVLYYGPEIFANAGFALRIGTYLIGQFTPWCMATLGSSGTFFFFAAMCFPYLAIMRYLVPEKAGKSLEEIEAYWA